MRGLYERGDLASCWPRRCAGHRIIASPPPAWRSSFAHFGLRDPIIAPFAASSMALASTDTSSCRAHRMAVAAGWCWRWDSSRSGPPARGTIAHVIAADLPGAIVYSCFQMQNCARPRFARHLGWSERSRRPVSIQPRPGCFRARAVPRSGSRLLTLVVLRRQHRARHRCSGADSSTTRRWPASLSPAGPPREIGRRAQPFSKPWAEAIVLD